MIAASNIKVFKSDGSNITIHASPTTFDDNGKQLPTGVFNLTGNSIDYGQLAFDMEDFYNWEYIGEQLNDNEVAQVVKALQDELNGDTLHSFFFNETVEGVEHFYRINENEGHFGIEKDGHIIAEIQNNEVWEQTSGEPLPPDVIAKLAARIEDHYE
jgi:hypothetical protein